MANWILASLLLACLLCFVQAFPQEAQPEATTQASKIGSALNDVMEQLQKGLKTIMEDPGLNKLVKDGQTALENAAQTIQTEAAKMMPKTES